ncbi:hypothetical protein OF83DRAFT_1169256 [Amylostereum chailletii]|nr:hypothetical protein OF83DRAFT_1169256 [Amylostereum chailletii]
MILEGDNAKPSGKLSPPDIDVPPPSYQSAVESSSSTSPTPGPSQSVVSPRRLTKFPKPKSPKSPSWLPNAVSVLFGPSKTSKQVRSTTQALIRDLLKAPEGERAARKICSEEAERVLDSCRAACEDQRIDFAHLLQEPFIEGHTAAYWAILIRPPSEPKSAPDDTLITAILNYSVPLNAHTISEVRHACTFASDNALLDRLRVEFDALECIDGSEAMILNADGKKRDKVMVDAPPAADGAFVVDMRVPLFQKRMRVVGKVKVEFIARGRLFYLTFFVNSDFRRAHNYKTGAWLLSLGLEAPSSPTWIDARLTLVSASTPAILVPAIPDPPPETPSTPPSSRSSFFSKALPSIPPSDSIFPTDKKPKVKPPPEVSVRLKSGSSELEPGYHGSEIISNIGEGVGALQFEGSPFIDDAGTLYARLEARLAKPDSDCIIC